MPFSNTGAVVSIGQDLTGFQRCRFELDSTWSEVYLRRKVGCETCQVWDAPLILMTYGAIPNPLSWVGLALPDPTPPAA
jgi:hypothetical protein